MNDCFVWPTFSRIALTDFVQTNGTGASLCLAMQSISFCSKSATEQNTPRLIAFSVINPKKRSIRLSHDELVGMKRSITRLLRFKQFLTFWFLCVA